MPNNNDVLEIPLDEIHFDEDFNCRMNSILPIQVKDLVESIKESGLVQPVVVTENTEERRAATGYKYRLIVGYRRYTAHKVMKAETIRALVDHNLIDEEKAKIFNLTENLQRSNLTMLEEAKAMAHLVKAGQTVRSISKKLSMPSSWVQIRLTLLKLPEAIQTEAALGWLTGQQVQELYTVYRKYGAEKTCEKVRDLKVARERGQEIKVIQKTKSPFAKSKKKPTEIVAMMEVVREEFGPCLALRALAWSNGKISDYEFYCTIQAEVEKNGGIFVLPYSEDDITVDTRYSI